MATGFGKTVWCLDKRATGRFVDGVAAVAQSAYRCLITPPGMLQGIGTSHEEAQAFGLDLSGYCGEVDPELAAASLPSRIEAALTKDTRIESVDTTIGIEELEPGNFALNIEIRAVTSDPQGTFTLTLQVTSDDAELLGITTS